MAKNNMRITNWIRENMVAIYTGLIGIPSWNRRDKVKLALSGIVVIIAIYFKIDMYALAILIFSIALVVFRVVDQVVAIMFVLALFIIAVLLSAFGLEKQTDFVSLYLYYGLLMLLVNQLVRNFSTRLK